MSPTTTIPSLHSEYRLWMQELNFFKEEVCRFERFLEDKLTTQTVPEDKASAEQFQNRFIREKEVIDELKHTLNQSEQQLAAFVKELNGLGLHCIKIDNHSRLRVDMRLHRRLYGELRTAFRRFELRCQ